MKRRRSLRSMSSYSYIIALFALCCGCNSWACNAMGCNLIFIVYLSYWMGAVCGWCLQDAVAFLKFVMKKNPIYVKRQRSRWSMLSYSHI